MANSTDSTSAADTEANARMTNEQRFPIVALGASAGGLEALRQFFSAMPADQGIGFIVIVHLHPESESHLAELLGADTSMPVTQAKGGETVQRNQVYVIPPNRYLNIEQGTLRLGESVRRPAIPKPIDHFFCSLGEDQGEYSISIVLTGADSDGTVGIKEIKAAGGMIMVQSPETARYPTMPRSAIATGLTDFVLPITEMPTALMQYIEHAKLTAPIIDTENNRQELDEILTLLRQRAGFDFRCYKKGMLSRRILRRIGLRRASSFADYYKQLCETPDEIEALAADLLIGVTEFFREPEGWQVFASEVIPQLLRRNDADAGLRIWVPGCASGEEAYTIGILLLEALDAAKRDVKVDIFATDIDRRALDIARLGCYPESIANVLLPERLQRFFVHLGDDYQVNKALRDRVLFAPQNLVTDPPFSRLDLISCHNLLIYLEPELQKRLIELFHFALNPGGYLFLGKSETVGQEQTLFETVSKKWRIYRSIGPTRRVPMNFPMLRDSAASPRIRGAAPQPAFSYINLIRDQLLARHTAAAVLINRDHQTLYFYGETGDFLAQPEARPAAIFSPWRAMICGSSCVPFCTKRCRKISRRRRWQKSMARPVLRRSKLP